MRNIKDYADHLRESEAVPEEWPSLANLWVVYLYEGGEWHFIAAYDDVHEATERLMEEADDFHGDAIEDRMQRIMDDNPDEFGEGLLPSEIQIRDADKYQDLWLEALDYVQNNEEGEGREYGYGRLKHIEHSIRAVEGDSDNMRAFMKEMEESEDIPEWARTVIRKSLRSQRIFGRS